MSAFEVVPDAERAHLMNGAGRPREPLTIALVEGRTVFLPEATGGQARSRGRRAAQITGRRLVTRTQARDGVMGVYAWLEDRR